MSREDFTATVTLELEIELDDTDRPDDAIAKRIGEVVERRLSASTDYEPTIIVLGEVEVTL